MTSKSTSRSRKTYVWSELKAEFMAGHWLEVAPFAKDRLGSKTGRSGWIGKNTKGWAEEKAENKKQIAERVMKANEKKEENEMVKALENIRKEIVRRAQPHASIETQVRDLNVLWNMIRVENGMPTTIAKNENRNHDDTALEKKALDDLLNIAKDANASGQSNATNQA
jgi:hypothetical protein